MGAGMCVYMRVYVICCALCLLGTFNLSRFEFPSGTKIVLERKYIMYKENIHENEWQKLLNKSVSDAEGQLKSLISTVVGPYLLFNTTPTASNREIL